MYAPHPVLTHLVDRFSRDLIKLEIVLLATRIIQARRRSRLESISITRSYFLTLVSLQFRNPGAVATMRRKLHELCTVDGYLRVREISTIKATPPRVRFMPGKLYRDLIMEVDLPLVQNDCWAKLEDIMILTSILKMVKTHPSSQESLLRYFVDQELIISALVDWISRATDRFVIDGGAPDDISLNTDQKLVTALLQKKSRELRHRRRHLTTGEVADWVLKSGLDSILLYPIGD